MMERLYNAAAAMRSTLLCHKNSNHHGRTVRAAKHMDPIVRSALAEAVQEQDCQADLDEIEAELAQAVTNLQGAVEKETFLGLRSRHYRKALDARARALHDERETFRQQNHNSVSHDDDEEEAAVQKQWNADWESRMEQWEKDEDALKSIQETQLQILATCEQMRRTIDDLNRKKAAMNQLNDQCQDFLVVAAEAAEGAVTKEPADLELTTQVIATSMEEGASNPENDVRVVPNSEDAPNLDEPALDPESPDLQQDKSDAGDPSKGELLDGEADLPIDKLAAGDPSKGEALDGKAGEIAETVGPNPEAGVENLTLDDAQDER